MKPLRIIFILVFTPSVFFAQGFVWGIKGGSSIGSQRWGNGGSYDNSLLFKYHGAAFIENVSESNTSVLFAQAGYHARGSAFRYRKTSAVINGSTVDIPATTQEFIFNNVGLIVGAKRRGVMGSDKAFYTIGLRGEYTVKTNLQGYDPNSFYTYNPEKAFVRKLNYGLTVSGGYEFPFSDLIGGFIEIGVHPDISRQYYSPSRIVYDPYSRQNITLPEQSIRNLTIEISLGLKFLRKIDYID